MKAHILTPWIGDGLSIETAYRPKIINDYAVKMEDVTEQDSANLTPDPNLYIIGAECDQSTLSAILADSNYLVLWHE